MQTNEPIALKRDVEANLIPAGTQVTLREGELAHVTQSLGGSYTVIVNGNMFRLDGKNADALGFEISSAPTTAKTVGAPASPDELEKHVWDAMKSCFDPEIPVNIVDLGLIYDCQVTPLTEGSHRVDVKMTLTAPGCGMGPTLAQDVENKLLSIEGIDEAGIQLVWDPQWNQGMMSEAARLQLGLY